MAAAPHADPRLLHYWTLLEEEEKRASLERQKLRKMWTKINTMQENNDAARRTFEERASFDFVPGNTRISLNVGGEIFETTANVLCQDRFSLLAALCRQNPPKPFERDPSGSIFLDRDWWIFRHILQFLRTGRLPTDATLLNELYEEASFYHLNLLRRAIKVHMVKGDGLQDPNTRMDEFGDRPRFSIAPQPNESAASEGQLSGRTDHDANEDSGVTPNDEIREGGRNSSNMGKGRGGDGRRKRGNLRGRGEGKRKRKRRGDDQCDFRPGWPAGPPPIGHAAWADPSKWGPPIEFWGTMGPPPPGHPAWWQALGVPLPPDHPAWSTMGPMGSVGPWMGMVDRLVRPPINPPPFLHPRGRPGAQPPQPPLPPLPPKSLPEGDVEQITGAENGERFTVPTPKEATSESRVTEVVDNKGTVSSVPSKSPEDKTKNSKNATPKADRTLPVVIQRRCRTPLMTLTGSYCPLLPDVLSVELYCETALGRDGGGTTLMNQLEDLKRCNSEATDMVVADEVSSSPTTTPIPIEGEENQRPKEAEAVPEENDSHNLKEDLCDGTAHEESGGDDEDDLYGDLFINDGERNEGSQRDVKGSTYGGDNGQGDRDDETQNSNAAALGGPAFEIEPNTIRAAMNALCALEKTVMMPSLVPETDELENALGLLSVPLAVIGM